MVNALDSPVGAILKEVRRVDWHRWAIPLPDRLFAYDPVRVVPAFEALVNAATPEQAQTAYQLILTAIAHNHSGTPYVAIAPAAPLLAKLVPHLGAGGPVGMEALAHCASWSAGEPRFVGPDGVGHDLEAEAFAAASRLQPLARRWLADPDEHRRSAAAELLDLLAEREV